MHSFGKKSVIFMLYSFLGFSLVLKDMSVSFKIAETNSKPAIASTNIQMLSYYVYNNSRVVEHILIHKVINLL